MKVARPPDQEMRDKEGPVCSVQCQTEPVASFVPQKPFHHKAHSPILLLLPFPPPPPQLSPHLRKNPLDLRPTLFKLNVIQNQAPGLLLFLAAILIYFLSVSPPSHASTTLYLKGQFCPHLNMWMHRWFVFQTSQLGRTDSICVYSTFFWEHELILKKNVMWHSDTWGSNIRVSRLQSALWPLRH